MKEFIEKLIGRLKGREKYYHECALDEIMKNGHTLDAEGFLGKEDAYGDVLSIVNQLAEEYGNQVISSNDLEIIGALPSLYPLQDFEEEAIQRVVENKSDGFLAVRDYLTKAENI